MVSSNHWATIRPISYQLLPAVAFAPDGGSLVVDLDLEALAITTDRR
ncbi:MAG: hypothetical protein GY856_51580 [bacterium]|nr:hypothetical protein [bacterium]